MWFFWEIILRLYCGPQTLLCYLLFLMGASEPLSYEEGKEGCRGARILVITSVRTTTHDW